jgi:hypothetical protein
MEGWPGSSLLLAWLYIDSHAEQPTATAACVVLGGQNAAAAECDISRLYTMLIISTVVTASTMLHGSVPLRSTCLTRN